MKASSSAENAACLEKLVDFELSKTLTSLAVAQDDLCAGYAAAANHKELSAHRAFDEALRLFKVLRHHMRGVEARRLAVRIKAIGRSLHGA